MRHLTEDTLIQYQFDLLSESKRQKAAEHLEACAECRQALTALQEKFGVLDVLNAEETLPQELVAATVAGAQRPRSAGWKPALSWRPLLAAAAVLVIGFLWLQRPDSLEDIEAQGGCVLTESEREGAKQIQIAMRSAVKPSAATLKEIAAADSEMTVTGGNDAELSRRLRSGLLSEDELGAGDSAGVRVVKTEEIPDKPPFAPASAIELVMLPRPEAMQVTIYNAADLTLVRDTRKLTLKPGWNWLQFMWAGTKIDPTSLSLRPLEHADKVSIEQLVYPAGLTEIGRWLVRSEVEGAVEFEITYFTSGLSWRAVYEGTLSADERTMDLKGYVRVDNNSGQDYVNTQTRLLLGQVRLLDEIKMLAERKYPYGPAVPQPAEESLPQVPIVGRYFSNAPMLGTALAAKAIEKEGLSEYTLYTIEGTEDLQDGWGKRLESLDVSGIPVKSVYKYDEDRYGQETVRFVSFVNDEEHEMGTSPLPEGSIHLYRNVRSEEGLSFVGQSAFKYIPVNQDVELNLGGSPLVKVEPKLMDYKTDNYLTDKDGNIYTGYLYKDSKRVYNVIGCDEIETWTIELTNARDVPAEIEVTRSFGTDAWTINLANPESEARNSKQIQNSNGQGSKPADVNYEKLDKQRARFTVTLQPRSQQTFTYGVTKYQGRRSEHCARKQKEQ
jgi:hypothetical protein